METPVKATGYKDIYQEVTETVIKLLEEGTVIWQRSWHDRGWPKNHLTQLHFRGWNSPPNSILKQIKEAVS